MTPDAARGMTRGGYRTPERRTDRVEAVAEALTGARRIVLTTHLNADGDGAGCEVALASWLRARGASCFIVNPTPYPGMYDFLFEGSGLDREELVLDARSQAALRECRTADLAVILDTGEKPRIGRVNRLIDEAEKVVIDHHQPGEAPVEGLSLRDAEAAATGELLYDVLLAVGDELSPTVARGLYVAILTDTGSFRFSNTSPATLRIAANLLEAGVDPEEIFRNVYATAPLRRYRLLREALDHLHVDQEYRIAWITVPRRAYDRLDASGDDLEGIVEYPRSIQGVEVALIFRETAKGGTKVSFRSNGPVNVDELAARFGGGGHRKAAGALVEEGRLEEVRERVLDATRAEVAGTVEGVGA